MYRLKKADSALRFFFIGGSYGRGAGVGRDLDGSVPLGVGVGLGGKVAVAVGVGVGVGAGSCAQYLPPVRNIFPRTSYPPQVIISLPVHTAV